MKAALKSIDGGAKETARSSEQIRAEIAETERALSKANAGVQRLAGEYDAAIMKGDAAAEANERETTAAKRAARRAELSLSDLGPELEVAIEREKAEALAKVQAAAGKQVDDFMRTVDTEYSEPASRIAAFLSEYDRVESIAREAGIPGPSALRCRPGEEIREPDQVIVETFYIDEHGNETGNEFPVGAFRLHPQTGEKLNSLGRPLRPNPSRTRTRIEPGKVITRGAVWKRPLSKVVSLPGFGVDETDHRSGSDVRVMDAETREKFDRWISRR
jgi:hypothetical protein